GYQTSLSGLAPALAAAESSIQAQFDSQVNNALATWQAAEQSAWTTYQTAYAQTAPQPPLGARLLAPRAAMVPPVVPFLGFPAQPRAQLPAKPDPDIQFVRADDVIVTGNIGKVEFDKNIVYQNGEVKVKSVRMKDRGQPLEAPLKNQKVTIKFTGGGSYDVDL